MPWINSDGLPVLFGVEETTERNVGEFGNLDGIRWVEIRLKADELPAVADNSVILERTYKLPAGAVVTSVELSKPTTAWVGTGATVNIGTVDSDDGTSNPDVDYLVVEIDITELNAGGKDVAGWIGAGVTASPAVPLTQSKYITIEVNTAAVTAGEATLYVYWTVPNIEDDSLVYVKP